jgi:uncharacterized RDD family membrane protein YckC
MQCQNCGRDYPGKLSVCTHCGQRSTRQTQRPSQSQLLEFPYKQRMAEVKEPSKPSLPAWRVELNEKVRARKAQKEAVKGNEFSSNAEPVSDSNSPSFNPEAHSFTPNHNGSNAFSKNGHPGNSLALEGETPAVNKHANNSRIVENALSRVKRASENALRASLPRIEPLRSSHAATSLAVDREATARLLEPPIPTPEEQPAVLPQPIATDNRIPQRVQREIVPQIPTTAKPSEIAIKVCEPIRLLDEDQLLDYLDAEVEKVDRELHEKMGLTDSPDLYTHALINVIDLLVIGLSCTPFFALIKFINGSLFESGALLSALIIGALISCFYLALTQLLCGRTFGMMAANAHVVDALNNEPPAVQMVLIRTFGYFVSALPAFAGFFWITLDLQSRSWHDKLSGTMIVRDF